MVNFSGTWKNQHNSTLELSVANGIVSGRFESGVGDDGQILWVEVQGRVLDDVITFNVVYEKFKSLVTWVGQHTTIENDIDIFKTQWLHVTDIPDAEEQAWMWFTNRIGADVFTRVMQ